MQQHQKKLESLGSSAAAVSEAWIGGDVSSAYTQTSFGQILLLVEQERTAIVSKPDALADPRAADLSQRADQLSRLLALMTRDVQARDANALRAHLAQIPLRPSS